MFRALKCRRFYIKLPIHRLCRHGIRPPAFRRWPERVFPALPCCLDRNGLRIWPSTPPHRSSLYSRMEFLNWWPISCTEFRIPTAGRSPIRHHRQPFGLDNIKRLFRAFCSRSNDPHISRLRCKRKCHCHGVSRSVWCLRSGHACTSR